MNSYQQINPDECEFIPVTTVEQLGNGQRLFVQIDELSIVIFNIGGKYFAIADLCSHDEGPLGDGELVDYEIHCPRHGASFDVRNGKVLSLPAIVDIPAFPVRVLEGHIEVGLPKRNS